MAATYTDARGERAKKMRARGKTIAEIATALGTSASTLHAWSLRYKLWPVATRKRRKSK